MKLEEFKEKYSKDKIIEILDEEILNWVDSGWEEDGCENKYEWYSEFNNKEAEDQVLVNLLQDASEEDKEEIEEYIKSALNF